MFAVLGVSSCAHVPWGYVRATTQDEVERWKRLSDWRGGRAEDVVAIMKAHGAQ